MGILYLTLKKQWFDLILHGIKREEYRDIKPYWSARLESKYGDNRIINQYDYIQFSNGYSKTARKMLVKCNSITVGKGIAEWGAVKDKTTYIIKLGRVISTENINSYELND